MEELPDNRFLKLSVLSVVVIAVVLLVYMETSIQESSKAEELTKYQQLYVDCPSKYLGLCTKMSKIPTEEVEFEKAEDGKLYLNMPRTNRTMVAKIQGGGKNGYLIRIEE